jgi:predicted ATPase
VEEGSLSEALASFSETVEWARMSGGEMAFVHILRGVSQAYLKMADAEKGLAAVSEALGVMEASGDKSAEAELYRVKGELLLMQDASKTAEAEQSLRKAIEVAHRQEAKFYELRATMSLARLFAKQGHRHEARAILADIYAWFTEGFDTADLKDAKALLDELGA